MDDIWRKAAKNLRKREERLSAIRTGPETKPAAIAATTTTPAYTYPVASANTVAQVDIRLLEMEQNWVQTRAGPFPEGIRNTVMDLRAALVIREEAARGTDSLLQVAEEEEIPGRRERSQEDSRKKEKAPKFNWADDADVPLTSICSGCSEPVLNATDDMSATVTAPTAPTTHMRDFSALRSSAPNPWASLRRRHHHRYLRTPRQSESVQQGRFARIYPMNSPIHKHPIFKSKPASSFRVFETVTHPYGIGPSKPVIRVPTRMTGDTPAHHAQRMDCAIVKPATPPLSRSIAAIRCQCGQIFTVSNTLQPSPSPLHHTLSTFISHFISRPLALPAQFFSRFMFS
jgi:hypothetical protein